ncbi:MAG: DUF362 domain-containing protein [Candidatus Aminicenantes bacterium]|nr:DUF362 domain-containing protein [Candidatus Aminicenantes bacterium]
MKTNAQTKIRPAVTRRSFMRGAAYGTLGAVIGFDRLDSLAAAGRVAPFAAPDPASRLILVRDEAAVDEGHLVNAQVVAAMVDRAVQELAGETDARRAWARFFKPEDTVAVKFTHCGWMRVHTEQAVVDAVIARLKGLGIPAGRIHAADGGQPLKECTALVNIPSVKVHTLTGFACSVKNYINFTGRESSYHGDGNAKLADSFLLPDIKGKTRLIVVDFLRPYFGPGPQINPLHRWDYKGVLAGTDPVAVDTTALRICQVKRDAFKGEPWPVTPPPRFLAAAEQDYKLGTADPQKIQLVKLGWDKDILI